MRNPKHLAQVITDYATTRAGQMRALKMLPYLVGLGYLLKDISDTIDKMELEGKLIDCEGQPGPVDWELVQNAK